MKRARRFLLRAAIVLSAVLVLTLTASCSKKTEEEPFDEHYGMIEVPYSNRTIWIKPKEGARLNDLTSKDFNIGEDGSVTYTGKEYDVMYGVDISSHQSDIDWDKVKESGIDFVYIRVGYRGYTEGLLHTDAKFYSNILGARRAGVKIGVYFFSQAINLDEVDAEAEYFLNLIERYKDDISLPVIYDWEVMDYRNSRTKFIDLVRVTDFAKEFCSIVEAEGYETGLYFNRHTGYDLRLEELQDKMMWFAGLQDHPNFHYRVDMWQYSFSGQVDGIPGEVDLDIIFTPKA